MKPEQFQGFWKALSERDGAAEKFANLLVLCEEFSVKLDYSTPVSGGEWIVTVAHFGDRTEFRFPRLNFDARDAYNTISQRLVKAKAKLEAEQEKEAEAPKSTGSKDQLSLSDVQPPEAGSIESDSNQSSELDAEPSDPKPMSSESTPEPENQSSSNGETVSETTTEPENGAEKSAKKKEKK